MTNHITINDKDDNIITKIKRHGHLNRCRSFRRALFLKSGFISLIFIGLIVIMSESDNVDAASTAFSYSSYTAFNRQKPVAAASSSEDVNGDDNESSSNNNEDAPSETDNPSIPQLMPADPNDTSIPTVTLGGDAVSLDALGPIVLNLDGSTSRIDNWETMTEREKEVTKRRIGKRNKERRDMLLEQQKQQQQQGNE